MSFTYEFARPSLTVDIAVLTTQTPARVLLIRRRLDPFAGRWALPGGFVDPNEPLETAARRELLEETGIIAPTMNQFSTFGDPGRDPRGWTVSVVFLTHVNEADIEPNAADDAAAVGWHALDRLPDLAFDHEAILTAIRHFV